MVSKSMINKLKKMAKDYQQCRMAFFSLVYQYEEMLVSEGKLFREEIIKIVPSFPLMDYLRFKPLHKILPETYIRKMSDDAAGLMQSYHLRSWFTDMTAECNKKKAITYNEVDKICDKYIKANKKSKIREPSRTDKGLVSQLDRKQSRIIELEQMVKLLKAENAVLKAENARLLKKVKPKFAKSIVNKGRATPRG